MPRYRNPSRLQRERADHFFESHFCNVAAAVVGSAVVGAYGASKSAKAARGAAQTQADSAQAGIDAQQAQFDRVREMLQPFVDTGVGALGGQKDLLGLNGYGAQQGAINGLQSSPYFTAMQQQGENRILQNASATGGLRGGNVQGALAQFSPQLLAQTIQQQYANLGGLSTMGQNAAAGVGTVGKDTTNGISGLLQQQGSALAGGMIDGNAAPGYVNAFGGALGLYKGLGGFSQTAGAAPVGITGAVPQTPTFGMGYQPNYFTAGNF